MTGPGSVVGQGLAEHDGVNAVTFTGSNQVGKIIGQAALARGAKYQLEMGGKNPVIVADDADLEAAAEAVITGLPFNRPEMHRDKPCHCTKRNL